LALAPPVTPAGPEPDSKDEVGALSSGGEDRGVFELGLGSVVLGVGVSLLAVGTFQLKLARDRKAQCASFDDWSSSCDLDPPGLISAASVLSFAFSVPAFVGGALLINRGAKIHGDYRAVRKAQVSVGLTPRFDGARRVRGASFGACLRF
jgi:hypothetical protein